MAYVEQADIVPGQISQRDFVQLTDDNKDNAADPDVWAAIQTSVQTDIDGVLGQRFSTPFAAPIPAIVKSAAQIFALEKLYLRRNLAAEKNPVTVNANKMREKLVLIAEGKEPLDPGQKRATPSVSVITEPSRTHSDRPAI